MKKLFFMTLLALIFTGCKKDSNADTGGVILGTFTGNLDINSQSSLDAAIPDGSYINSIGGNLVVSTGASTGITVEDVEYISSQINSVGGDVTINTPDGSLNLSELSSVGGNYSIQGSDANDDKLLTVGGDITLNYEGDYSMPNLTSAGKIIITPIGTSTASKKGERVLIILSFPKVILLQAMAIAGIPASLGLDFTSFIANAIGGIVFGPGILIDELVAPDAIEIILKNTEPLAKLIIVAPNATNIEIATTAVNGLMNILTSTATDSTFTAPTLTTVQGDVTINCGKVTLLVITTIAGNCSVTAITFSANNITSVTGNLSIRSDVVSMTILETVGGNLTVTGTNSGTTADSANFENLTNVGGELAIDAEEVEQDTGQPHNSGGN